MLEEHDIKKIDELIKAGENRVVDRMKGEVVKVVVDQVVDAIGDTLMPTLDKIFEKVDNIEHITAKKLGQSVARDKVLDRKIESVGEVLTRHQVFTPGEMATLHQMEVFTRENS